MKKPSKTQIIATGAAIPTQRVKSDDLLASVNSEQRFGVPHNFISNTVGIIERRVADTTAKPSDLAIEASINAMSQCGIDALDIDMIIYCGIDRDWVEPSTAHRVQDALGAKNAFCFDISNACHGMMNGLDVANSKIQLGEIETALICTGEKASEIYADTINKLNNPNITAEEFQLRLGALTLGDAGGAFIVHDKSQETGIEYMQLYSAGQHAELCSYTRNEQGIDFQMHMAEICAKTIKMYTKKLRYMYGKTGWQTNDIDHFICHQVGKVPQALICKISGIDINKAACTYSMLGNITSATIAVAIALTPFKTRDKMLILSSGSGITIGSTGMVCSYDNNVDYLHSTLNYRSDFKAINCA